MSRRHRDDRHVARILILYSTVDGHTRAICERLRTHLAPDGHDVAVLALKDHHDIDVRAFDKIVIGASIRYGKHRPYVADFINRNAELLGAKPGAFFTVNVVARKADKATPETNPYLGKFLRQIHWQPQHLAVFAGKIDYPKYRFVDRTMIRVIMWMTKGPTDTHAIVDFTDWKQVEAFAHAVSRM